VDNPARAKVNRGNLYLRFLLLAALAAWFLHVAYNSPWLGVMNCGNHTWFIPMENAPIWLQRPPPDYDRFLAAVADIPERDTPGLEIDARPEYSHALIFALLGLWPITLVIGILYSGMAGVRRDPWLRASLGIGIGITCGALLCFVAYTLLGGWGPPYPAEFALVGAAGGGIASLCWRRSQPNPSQTT
jgi:hypothetical protein